MLLKLIDFVLLSFVLEIADKLIKICLIRLTLSRT